MNRRKRQQQILDTARKLFVHKGYTHINVSSLVRKAEVSRGTFYLYFKSKEDVMTDIINSLFEDLDQAFQNFSTEKLFTKHLLDREKFDELVRAVGGLLFESQSLIVALRDRYGELEKSHQVLLSQKVEQLRARIKGSVSFGVKEGVFSSIDASVTARILQGALIDLLFSDVASLEIMVQETAKVFHFVLSSLVNLSFSGQQDLSASEDLPLQQQVG